jgi:hypothetical protein
LRGGTHPLKLPIVRVDDAEFIAIPVGCAREGYWMFVGWALPTVYVVISYLIQIENYITWNSYPLSQSWERAGVRET